MSNFWDYKVWGGFNLVAVLLICTNGYEILRGHIMQVLKGGEVS